MALIKVYTDRIVPPTDQSLAQYFTFTLRGAERHFVYACSAEGVSIWKTAGMRQLRAYASISHEFSSTRNARQKQNYGDLREKSSEDNSSLLAFCAL